MATMTREISNYDDVIDSRDVIERIEFLENAIEGSRDLGQDIDEDEVAELAILRALADEASQYAEDWPYGETLIRDSYFVEYAEQLADDLGYMDSDATGRWPFTHIDWEAAARDLQQDYISVDFDGVTYWVR